MKGFYIEITNNLLEKKHRKKMGSAVWEFMWCLDKITKIDEDGMGWILGGKPINLKDLRKELGITEPKISKNLNKLKNEGYLNLRRTPYGLVISVNKAKKRFAQKPEVKKREKELMSLKEIRKKMSEDRKGEKCYNWKGGISPLNTRIRLSVESKLWRQEVFERDKYTCKKCGKIGGELESHHIKSFAKYPKLRFEVSNGETLCKNCHRDLTKRVNLASKRENLMSLRENLYRQDNRQDKKTGKLSSSKKLKPYFRGKEMRKAQGKWWVLPKDGGQWLEFAGEEKNINWKKYDYSTKKLPILPSRRQGM